MTSKVTLPELEVESALGRLNMLGWNESRYGDFELQVSVDGLSWGSPEQVRRQLRTALRDGSVSVTDRRENREIVWEVRIKAADGIALAGGEAALHELEDRRSEVTWYPPVDTEAPAAVFVVVGARWESKSNHREEMAKGVRYGTLTLEAHPHAYSKEWSEIPAVSSELATPVLVDDCDSLTGWSSPNATLALAGGGITSTTWTFGTVLVRSGAVDLTDHPYLVVRSAMLDQLESLVVFSGTKYVQLPKVGFDGDGAVFDASSLSAPVISEIRVTYHRTPEAAAGFAAVKRIDKQDKVRSVETRAKLQVLEVSGSARTPGSLLVESLTEDPIRQLILYTGPQYDPSFMSGVPGDAEAVGPLGYTLSGRQARLDSGDTLVSYRRAAEFPEGDYTIWASACNQTGSPVDGWMTVRAQLWTASGMVVNKAVTRRITLPTNNFQMHLLGSTTLPPGTLPPGTSLEMRFSLEWEAANDSDICWIDDVLFFNRSAGTLAIFEALVVKRVWLDAATLDVDRSAIYVSNGDKDQAFPLNTQTFVRAWDGAPVIAPPATHLYVGTPGYNASADTRVVGKFRAAWGTHPAA